MSKLRIVSSRSCSDFSYLACATFVSSSRSGFSFVLFRSLFCFASKSSRRLCSFFFSAW